MIQIKKGLDLPISGAPKQQIETAPSVKHVALLGRDYHSMKPTLMVGEGDWVRLGQPLFSDKKNPQVLYTAPATGKVVAINRGERRVFLSMVIRVEGDDELTFPSTAIEHMETLTSEEIEAQIINAGLWPALRTRPYSKVPVPGTRPAALFVTAIDTNPLSASPNVVIQEKPEEFKAGLVLLQRLIQGTVYLCTPPQVDLPIPQGIEVREFSGCHPAGLVGTHIHFLERVDQQRTVWHINYQDVVAVGYLFLKGRLLDERIVALGGPAVKSPRLVRTRPGACLSELTADQLNSGENRVISGSVLSGHTAADEIDFLGRYHTQVSVLAEGRQREFLGWALPGLNRFSVKKLFVGTLWPRQPRSLTTSTHGSVRAMVPTGAFEKVMPLNVKATWLLRALLTQDTDLAQSLGCLELDEEDLSLCSFVCSGKMNYGVYLRQVLQKIEIEG
ncbi:MAG: Na(+)-translocating NADH-quinone reductase subunit A [Deltaproteobacteria bacterium]|jgi:Na+-transporting NADH:ubiquinone oxidoreductase subunit A|nr:Na(+)-translocating NADH-quinone reductase subunit A [Deltaproteobacteria bacterium]MBW2476413.1 Na(+)-translocating NADH-quinone reductase subunit A [Deltaproteobacteria bacterium]MBW2503471.1 Na(+)-translocating NADH-quinone reductase subunit A [Deltaproteobacteria bacterium]MBW2519868.1 Na(+)-translocating NADH-quinone reductase subunit A [Deltaproteobacteria bacterium]